MKNFLRAYLAHRPPFLALIRAKEAVLFAEFMPLPGPVLDVGCGDGFFAKTVFGHVDVGVDVAGSRIDQAKKTGAYTQVLEFDGVKIPLVQESVETVVCNCTLEHVQNLDGLIKEMYRVTQPGGRLLTTVMAKPWEDNLVGSMILGTSYKMWLRNRQQHFNLLNYNEWSSAFRRHGWKVVRTVGYLSPATCQWLDVLHYVSVPYLISYVMTKRWTWWPNVIPVAWMERMAGGTVATEQSGAIWFELRKVAGNRAG